MRKLLRNLWQRRGQRLASRRPAFSAYRARPVVEGLEARTLLSITFSGANNSGVATLTGTPQPDQFVIRISPTDATMIEFSDNGGSTFTDATLSGITSITVNGLQSRDTLTLDESNGLIATSGGLPITFDGGPGRDTLILVGNPNSGKVTETFTPGTTSNSGMLAIGNGTLSSTVQLTSVEGITDLMTADTLTINGNGQNSIIHIREGHTINGVKTNVVQAVNAQDMNDEMDDDGDSGNSSDNGDNGDNGDGSGPGMSNPGDNKAFMPITFANKTNVVVNGLGGDDLFVLSVSKPAAGLQQLTLHGGTGTNEVVGREFPSSVTLTLINIQQQMKDPDDMFIQEMYAERLGRLGSQAEIDGWKSVLQTAGTAAVVQGIEQSTEARDDMVKSWYQKFLGRTAQNGEEMPWVNALVQGATEEQVMAGILGSGEFQNRAQTMVSSGSADQNFVTALYQMLLGRTPSSSEVASWVAALPTLGHSGVAMGFVQSGEFRGDVITAFYTTMLNRDPDTAGLAAWQASNMNLTQIREGFESSGEFFANG